MELRALASWAPEPCPATLDFFEKRPRAPGASLREAVRFCGVGSDCLHASLFFGMVQGSASMHALRLERETERKWMLLIPCDIPALVLYFCQHAWFSGLPPVPRVALPALCDVVLQP